MLGCASLGSGRLHRMGSASGMRASVKALPSHVKAEVVYSADWWPCFFLKVGYFARPSKKFLKALSRCRRAGFGGTQDTALSQDVSGCCFKVVRAADVSE